MQSHIPPLGALGEEFEQVDLASVDEDMRVGVGGDRELPLPDERRYLGPRAALPVQERDPPVPQIVR